MQNYDLRNIDDITHYKIPVLYILHESYTKYLICTIP